MKKPKFKDIEDRRYYMENKFYEILKHGVGLDMSDPNMADTPKRLAKMYSEMFWGLEAKNEPKVTIFPPDHSTPEMVGTGKIFFASMCAHHMLPFVGHAHIFYIRDQNVIGLSKLTRIVNYFAARPQIQERMGAQIADFILDKTDAIGVYVVLRATHSCMQCRGVRQEGAVMVTAVIRPVDEEGFPVGPFSAYEPRSEALTLMEMDK